MADEDRIAAILADWHEQNERGEAPSPPEVVREHPDLAEELLARFATMELLDESLGRAPVRPEGPPQRLGEFRILRELGRGGMGVVYEAEQVPMGRRVALKVLYPSITLSHRAVERFQREARAAGRLHHTNIVAVHGMGEAQGIWYFAMELVEGRLLSGVIDDLRSLGGGRRGAPPPSATPSGLDATSGTREFYAQVARMFAGVADGLQSAHDAGILHRDLKPQNLILDRGGVLKILDFGLAKVEDEGVSMTATGDFLGTLGYMSPEQASGGRIPVDARSDVYSLGATLFEALTLWPPYRGKTAAEVTAAMAAREPPPPRRLEPRIPRDLETVVLKSMERDPRRRYATAGEMAADLRGFAEGGAIRARRIGPLGRFWRLARRQPVAASLAAAVALLAAGGAGLALHSSRQAALLRDRDYERLCLRAENAFGHVVRTQSSGQIIVLTDTARSIRETLSEAIAIRPDRWEAYLFRAGTGGATLQERLADLDEAGARGLSERACRLARSALLSTEGNAGAARTAAEEVGPGGGPEDPIADFFAGRLLLERGERKGAIARLDRALQGLPEGGPIRAFARGARAEALEMEGDLAGALNDLTALAGTGAEPRPYLRVRIASLWRRLGQTEKAATIFRESLDEIRRIGTEWLWHEFCLACNDCHEGGWLDLSSADAHAAFPASLPVLLFRAKALEARGDLVQARDLLDRAVVVAPRDSRGYTLRADFRLTHDKDGAATLKDIDQAIALDGKAACDHYVRAKALELMGRSDDALLAMEHAVSMAPNDHDVQHSYAEILDRLGQPEKAIVAIDRAIVLNPQCESAHVVRVNLLCTRGEYSKALEEAEGILRANQDSPAGHQAKGNALFRLRKFPEALAEIEKSVVSDPSSKKAHNMRAQILREMGNQGDALKEYDATIALDDKDAEAHFNRANVLLTIGDLEHALLGFDRAIALRPAYAEALANRGYAYLGLKKPKDALDCFDRAIVANPRLYQARKGRGEALVALDRCPEAVDEYERAIGISPDKAVIYNSYGNALRKLSRLPEARSAYEKGIALDPNLSPIHFNLGNVLRELGDYGEAIASFDRALAIDPRNAGAYFQRAAARTARGEDEKALADLERMLEIPPRLAVGGRAKAAVLDLLGRFDEGGRCLQAMIPALPKDSSLRVMLVEVMLDAGRRECALAAAEEALVQFPASAGCARVRVTCLRSLGRLDEARTAAVELLRAVSPPSDPVALAYLNAVAGDGPRARALLSEAGDPKDADGSFARARACAVLGDAEETVRWLRIASERGMRRSPFAAPDPDFASLDKVAGYRSVLERLQKGDGSTNGPARPR